MQVLDFLHREDYNKNMDNFYMCDLDFSTRYSDFDCYDRLKVSSLLGFMQEGAGISANELGCGSDFLWPKGWGFIVTNNYAEVYKPVRVNEKLHLKTWPLPPRHIIFERHYELFGESGEKVAAAVSRWCLLDLKNKKILPASALTEQDYSRYNPQKTMDFKSWKIPPVPTEGLSPAFSMRVYGSECDHYMHVNNTRYADFCMNCFSLEYLKTHAVRSFQIVYEEQCVEGDELSFYRIPTGEEEFLIVGAKEGNKQFMRAKIAFSAQS